MDITKFFDEIDHALMLKAVEAMLEEKWVKMYAQRWLEMKVEKQDGTQIEKQGKGTPQGGVITSLTHSQTLSFQEDLKLNAVSLKYCIKSSFFMTNEKSGELRIGQTYQQCVHHASKGKGSATDCGMVDWEVWCLASTGLSLCAIGQEINEKIAVPESSVVFTVKLPPTLIKRVKKLSKSKRLSISKVVHTALEDFLAKKDHAQKGETS